ncbi:MAG: hypothetical protein KGS48_19325 [Bacteroidetes bacterium]|nr:hypothetical protein [Bacteroidota bacterium]
MLMTSSQVAVINGNPDATALGTPAQFIGDDLDFLKTQQGAHSLREVIVEIDDVSGQMHAVVAIDLNGNPVGLYSLPCPPYCHGRPPRATSTLRDYTNG